MNLISHPQEKEKQEKLAKQRDKDKQFYEDQIIALKQVCDEGTFVFNNGTQYSLLPLHDVFEG